MGMLSGWGTLLAQTCSNVGTFPTVRESADRKLVSNDPTHAVIWAEVRGPRTLCSWCVDAGGGLSVQLVCLQPAWARSTFRDSGPGGTVAVGTG